MIEVLFGFVHDRATLPSFGVAAKPAGFAGSMVATEESDAAPPPVVFTARTWNVYVRPLSRPVTVWLVVEAPLPSTSAQSPQTFVEIRRRSCHFVIGEPPSPPEVQARVA